MINEQNKFAVDSIVRYAGVLGVVILTDRKKLRVKFQNHVINDFLLDGRVSDWHKKPLLELLTEQEIEELKASKAEKK